MLLTNTRIVVENEKLFWYVQLYTNIGSELPHLSTSDDDKEISQPALDESMNSPFCTSLCPFDHYFPGNKKYNKNDSVSSREKNTLCTWNMK